MGPDSEVVAEIVAGSLLAGIFVGVVVWLLDLLS